MEVEDEINIKTKGLCVCFKVETTTGNIGMIFVTTMMVALVYTKRKVKKTMQLSRTTQKNITKDVLSSREINNGLL